MAPSADPERQPLLRDHTGQTPSQNEAAGQQDTTGTSADDSNSIKSTHGDARSVRQPHSPPAPFADFGWDVHRPPGLQSGAVCLLLGDL